MNNRERILATFNGQSVDRPLFPFWLGFSPWIQTLQRWKVESGIQDLDIKQYFGFDDFFKQLPLEMGPFPYFEEEILEEDNEFITMRNSRGIIARNRKDGMSMPDFIDYPVHSESEWLRFKEERLQDLIDVRVKKMDDFISTLSPDDAIQTGSFPWGVFGTARDIVGAEELFYFFYDAPDMIMDIMNSFTDIWLKLFKKASEKVQIDHIHIWEDMCGKQGLLISPQAVEEFMMPQYDKIISFSRKNNIPIVSVDSDGMIDELLKIVVLHGINAFFPFEVQAGSDIQKFREIYPDLTIMGGLDKRALAKDKKSMHIELDRAEKMFEQGKYVVGFDHLIPPDVSWENYVYFIENLKRIIGI